MANLCEVQVSILNQMKRDFSDKSPERVTSMCICGLAEEAGEVAGLHKRELRQGPMDAARCTHEKFVEELGDVLWYLVAVCNCYQIDLDDLWQYNEEKLRARYGR